MTTTLPCMRKFLKPFSTYGPFLGQINGVPRGDRTIAGGALRA
jgi:hypothetical protein